MGAHLRFAQVVFSAAPDHDDTMINKKLQRVDQRERARLAVDNGQHDHAERLLELRMFVEIVQNHFRLLAALDLKDAYRTGRGQFTMRAKAAIERPAKEKVQIVITEIPFQVNKSRVIERIAELVQDKKIEGISDVRDESDRDGMRIVIEIKRGEQPEVILNNLYKHTQLLETFGMIMLAIVHGQPRTLPLIEALQLFIDHRVIVVRRRTEYDLRKAQERAHILEGFLKALSQLDAIIKLIRASKTPAEARAGLIATFEFSDRQAQAILEMQLQRLTAL